MRHSSFLFVFLTTLFLSGCGSFQSTSNNEVSLSQASHKPNLQALQNAAAAGDPDAQYALGYRYYYGKGGLQQNTPLAQTWIRRAAAQGQPLARQALGMLPPATTSQHLKKTKPIRPFNAELARKDLAKHDPLLLDDDLPDDADAPIKTVHAEPQPHHSAIQHIPRSHYAIQLMASHQRAALEDARSRINGTIYKTQRKNQPWYVLIYGNFKTHADATHAIQGLPEYLRQQHPWVKSYNKVNKEQISSQSTT